MNDRSVSGAPAPRARRLLAVLALSSSLVAPGCGKTAAPPAGCAADPFACAKGTTCWPTDKAGGFACLPSKDFAPKWTECELLAGKTTCADGMVCLTTDTSPDANAPRSYCAPW